MPLAKAWLQLTATVVKWFVVFFAVSIIVGVAIMALIGGRATSAIGATVGMVSLAITATLLYQRYGRRTFVRIVAWTALGFVVYAFNYILTSILAPSMRELTPWMSAVFAIPMTCGAGTLWSARAGGVEGSAKADKADPSVSQPYSYSYWDAYRVVTRGSAGKIGGVVAFVLLMALSNIVLVAIMPNLDVASTLTYLTWLVSLGWLAPLGRGRKWEIKWGVVYVLCTLSLVLAWLSICRAGFGLYYLVRRAPLPTDKEYAAHLLADT